MFAVNGFHCGRAQQSLFHDLSAAVCIVSRQSLHRSKKTTKMRNLRCGVLAIALLAHRVVGTASFSWLEPPPSTAVSNKETIPSLKISCSDKKTSDILQLDITAVSQTISAQLANGFATFTPFVLTRPGNQNISVILNGVPVLVAHIYVVPDTVDIGYLSYLDGDPTWSDLSLPPLILADVLNEGNQMIPNTTVKMHAYASDCSALVASKSLFQMLQAVEVVAIQGTDCSAPALVITPMTSAFGIPLISGDAGNAQLSNKNAYPMFMRTNPGGNFEALTLISLISYFKWPQIAVVTFTMFPLDDFFYSNLYQQNIFKSSQHRLKVLACGLLHMFGHLSFITLPANTNADLLSQIADRVNNDTYLIDRGLSTHNLLDRTHPTTGNGLIANGVAQDLDATLTIFYGLKSLISKRLDITGQTLFDEMLKQDFTGFSGRMRFDTNGDAYASATAGAMALNGTFQSIGTLRPINGSTLYTLDLSSTSSFEWPGGAPFESVPLAFKSVTACPVGFGRYLVGPVYSCIACPRGTYNWMSNNTDICSVSI
ncbi:periplasmic binding protein-like I [Chytriomyces sp. MP71]|nr:periplasmic binding protein-like I [Chytriomyces sp. MP71]